MSNIAIIGIKSHEDVLPLMPACFSVEDDHVGYSWYFNDIFICCSLRIAENQVNIGFAIHLKYLIAAIKDEVYHKGKNKYKIECYYRRPLLPLCTESVVEYTLYYELYKALRDK